MRNRTIILAVALVVVFGLNTLGESYYPEARISGTFHHDVVVNQTILFDGKYSLPGTAAERFGGTVVDYFWTVNGYEVNSYVFTYAFPSPGMYEVTLTVHASAEGRDEVWADTTSVLVRVTDPNQEIPFHVKILKWLGLA